jgi:predicted exporter/predicted hotdog family 3-hydroxylacyl-ACP dehydratase
MTNKAQFRVIVLLTGGLLLLLCLAVPRTHFSTSIIDLLPGNDPEVHILREMANLGQGKQITVRLYCDTGMVDEDTVNVFLAQLNESDAIDKAWVSGEEALMDTGAYVFQNRLGWLLPGWLDTHFPEWRDAEATISTDNITTRVADELDRFLQSPESIYFADTIERDPFLLLARSVESASMLASEPEGEDVFLWVKQAHSPFSDSGQIPVFKVLDDALEAAQNLQPGLRMEYSGISVFASASKAAIKNEIQMLNLLGLLLVLSITAFSVRDFQVIIRIGCVVFTALLTAVVTVVSVFPSVHIIALVIGSILTGVAVDYGFHLILKEKHGLPKRAIIKAVITGALSSSMGFIVLLLAPLPFLQQVGVFVGSGLLSALLVALLLRPNQGSIMLKHEWCTSPFCLPRWTGPVACLLFLPGVCQLQWKDSIRDLEYPLPELKALETRLRLDSSPLIGYNAYLVHATDISTARITLTELLQATKVQRPIHVGGWVPAFADAQGTQAFFGNRVDLVESLSRVLEERDYRPAAFEPFFSDWAAYVSIPVTLVQYETQISHFANSLPGPLSNFVHNGTDIAWYMALLPKAETTPDIPGVVMLDQANMLSEAFSEYRQSMLLFAGIGLFVLMLGVLVAYGFLRGTLALVITGCALLVSIGLSGYLGVPLGLFHVVGGLVAFCISLDYALFAVESHANEHRLPASISISALTTLGVFGLLALSHIPAVRQLAFTVLTLISTTLLLITAGWPLLKRRGVPTARYIERLPHGEAALMIDEIVSVDEKVIQVKCIPAPNAPVIGECLIEAMAQSAAAWLAYIKVADQRPRSGMLVLVQSCDLNERALPVETPYIAEVVSLSEAHDGLIFFEGKCTSTEGIALADARFSVFVEQDTAVDS